MRRVNVKLGIKQRVQDILGSGMDSVGTINAWSIQSAMISNSQRIAAAIVGEAANGRIMKGLRLSFDVSPVVYISSGHGFTPEGNVVVLQNQISISVAEIFSGSGYINLYLKHTLTQADSTSSFGKVTSFNNGVQDEQIVFDDYGVIKNTTLAYTDTDILKTVTNSEQRPGNGYVYIGKIVVDSDVVTSVVPSVDTGIKTYTYDGFFVDQKILNSMFTAGNQQYIELPVGYTKTNTVVLSFKVKGQSAVSSDIFQDNEWLVLPYSYVTPGSESTKINSIIITYKFTNDPDNNIQIDLVQLVDSVYPDPIPSFENVEYQIVIGKLDI
jgi:hypothetical protein